MEQANRKSSADGSRSSKFFKSFDKFARKLQQVTTPNKNQPVISVKKSKIDSLGAKATLAEKNRDWATAISTRRQIIKELGADTPLGIRLRLSMNQRKCKDFEGALQTVSDCEKVHGKSTRTQIELSEILVASNDWEKACLVQKGIIEDFPRYEQLHKIYALLAKSYNRLGDFSGADKILAEGFKKYPDSQELFIARAEAAMARQKWTYACELWEEAHSKFSDLPVGAWLGYIDAIRHTKDIDKMDAIAAEALKHHHDFQLWTVWAEVPSLNEDWKRALARWNKLWHKARQPNSAADDTVKSEIRFNQSVLERLVDTELYMSKIQAYNQYKKKREFVIYTSFTGDYDSLKLPGFIDPRFDYVAFTDKSTDGSSIFDIRPIPFLHDDPGKAIRYAKTHAHKLFPGYKAAIWVDASLLITDDIFPLLDRFLHSEKPIASTPHQHRVSVYEELEACIRRKKDDPKVMKPQVARYKKSGFDGNTLAENGLLMFNLEHKKLAPILETWWDEILNNSKRDQLSFGYALFKNKASWHHIVDKPLSIRNMPGIVLTPHLEGYVILGELNNKISSLQKEKTG